MKQPKGKFGRDPLTWTPMQYMNEYLTELGAFGRSPSYIAAVKLGLAHFSNFCTAEGVRHPDLIERQHILAFMGAMKTNESMKHSYVIQLMKYVRGWINWMNKVGYLTTNPWSHIRVGSAPKEPNPLEDEELSAIFDAHKREMLVIPPFQFHRREMILSGLYAWGLRAFELHALDLAQVDHSGDTISMIGKGGATKHVPYINEMRTIVNKWLRARAPKANRGEQALIIGSDGTRLSLNRMRRIVTEIAHTAGVEMHPHQLRDTCGTNLLDAEVPMERVQKILGHKNIAQTRSYSRVNDTKVHESHQNAMGPMLQRLVFERTGAPPVRRDNEGELNGQDPTTSA